MAKQPPAPSPRPAREGHPPEPDKTMGFLLHDVARLLRRNFNHRVQELGLTQAQYRVILHLSRCEGIQQVALAELLEIQPITLARLLDKLETGGLIERRRNPTDRRAFCLYLTTAAHPLLDQIWHLAARTRADAYGDLDNTRLDAFLKTLQILKTNLLQAESTHTPSAENSEEIYE